jgi:taurine--2-oxoglutarate transaminase
MSFFTNGGAEANENAIKLARWYTGRHKVIARYRSYHGATRRDHAHGRPAPLAGGAGMPGVLRMFDPYTYSLPRGHPDPCPGVHGRAAASRRSSSTKGPQTVAAWIIGDVTGTRRRHPPARRAILQSIREGLRPHGIVLIFDEVMAGFGRRGKWFSVRELDVVSGTSQRCKGDQLWLS